LVLTSKYPFLIASHKVPDPQCPIIRASHKLMVRWAEAMGGTDRR